MLLIIICDQAIGIFYADRQPSERKLDNGLFSAFQHFIREANLALAMVKRKH